MEAPPRTASLAIRSAACQRALFFDAPRLTWPSLSKRSITKACQNDMPGWQIYSPGECLCAIPTVF